MDESLNPKTKRAAFLPDRRLGQAVMQVGGQRFSMDEALKTVTQFLNEYATRIYARYFEWVQKMPGANRLFKRIASASDKEQLEDYFAEVRYALVFAGLGFQVEIEPSGRKGPDLGISRDNHQAIVEIMRFRKMYPGPPVLDLSGPITILPEYGNPPRDIRKAFEKILNKFSQVGGEESVIAIWNDDEDMEEVEVETAVIQLRNDGLHQIFSLPEGLQFVLYGSNAVYPGGRQLFCFPLRYQYQSHQISWQQELASSTANELIQRALS